MRVSAFRKDLGERQPAGAEKLSAGGLPDPGFRTEGG